MYLRPGLVVVIVGGILTSLSTILVALRYYCRYFLMGSVGTSDHLMLTALVLTWGNFVVNYYQDETSSHFRPSYIKIPEKRPEISATVRGTLITWWIYRISYIAALCFVKLSILFFYRAIATTRTFRRVLYATITFVTLYTLAACIAGIFQCQTPSDAWSTKNFFAEFDRTPVDEHESSICYDPTRLWVFCGAANLLTDVIIMMLPIPALLSLRIPMGKRLGLIGIFSVGIMAIVASSVRMWVMMLWAESPSNSARFGANLLLWGQVETNSGIVSASVPFLRLLVRGREKEGRGEVVVLPQRPKRVDAFSQHRGLDMDEWPLRDEKAEGEGKPAWGAFITVPEGLGEGRRDSQRLEPVHLVHDRV